MGLYFYISTAIVKSRPWTRFTLVSWYYQYFMQKTFNTINIISQFAEKTTLLENNWNFMRYWNDLQLSTEPLITVTSTSQDCMSIFGYDRLLMGDHLQTNSSLIILDLRYIRVSKEDCKFILQYEDWACICYHGNRR